MLHKALPYYIMLFVLELFIFFFVSHDHMVCDSDIYDYIVTDVILCSLYDVTSHLLFFKKEINNL